MPIISVDLHKADTWPVYYMMDLNVWSWEQSSRITSLFFSTLYCMCTHWRLFEAFFYLEHILKSIGVIFFSKFGLVHNCVLADVRMQVCTNLLVHKRSIQSRERSWNTKEWLMKSQNGDQPMWACSIECRIVRTWQLAFILMKLSTSMSCLSWHSGQIAILKRLDETQIG